MEKLKVLIIEDEPLAAQLIREYVESINFLICVNSFYDPELALEYLKKNHIDVIFLDIHLPQISGLEFINRLKIKPQIILTTAYHQYALESYEYHVVDYLLKPIEFVRFEIAINKLKRKDASDSIFVNINKSQVKINYNTIIYIESQRDYLLIYTFDGNYYKTKKTLTSIIKILPKNFLRIHRSFIINKNKVKESNASSVVISETTLPIGRKYRKNIIFTN